MAFGDNWALTTQSGPNVEPIPTSEAKDHLRVDSTAEDSLIDGLVSAARSLSEQKTRRAFVQQTLDYQVDDFPDFDGDIRLPRPPLQSVSQVTYTTTDGVVNTVSSSKYVVDSNSEPGRIVLKDGEDWPDDELQVGGAVSVRYIAGYSSNATGVPVQIRQAMKLMIGHWYENREQTVVGNITHEIPLGADALLSSPKFEGWDFQ